MVRIPVATFLPAQHLLARERSLATLLGEHTAEVLADWLGLDAAAVADLREDGIV
jgi:hypothetical protein